MAIRVSLVHRTAYHYDRLVTLSPQVIRLRPAPHCRTPINSYSLRIEPEQHFLNWQQDPHGNFLARAVFPNLTNVFSLEVALTAELTVINPFDFFLEPEACDFPFQYAPWLDSELAAYRKLDQTGPKFAELLTKIPREKTPTIDFLVALNSLLNGLTGYVIRLEPGVQGCEETLEKGTGSCRDSAWLMVQILRHLGLAARFVSGYLIQIKPDVKSLDGPSGTDHDFCDLHAWTEVYLPGAGWVGLDPTSGLFAGEGHLPLAATPDPTSAAPITGGVDECKTEFTFAMTVERIHEDPRVTKPYTDEQWAKIASLGQSVDQRLNAQDMRLTMGGEPTFVSIDNMDGPEWNTAAMGPHKRKLADELFQRLAGRFANRPLLHYGQGKWYPGEPLPRWAMGCYWRNDGLPIWPNEKLIASDSDNKHFGPDNAALFIRTLSKHLNVGVENITPAYEDALYYVWRERRLPSNVDPLKCPLGEPEERARLAKVFEQGLQKIVGYALPLRPIGRNAMRTQWQTQLWSFRTDHLYLIPGDSPMGLRLPLDSLVWEAPEKRYQDFARDPFAFVERSQDAVTPFADFASLRALQTSPASLPLATSYQRVPVMQTVGAVQADAQLAYAHDAYAGANGNGENGRSHDELPFASDHHTNGHAHDGAASIGDVGSTADAALHQPLPAEVVRTAICVEARKGILHIFMPPLNDAEDYLDLLAAVHATAAELSYPVRIEGYTPPYDPRLENFKVTPDPGVIEVNLQPASNWEDLVDNTTVLYEEARLARLGTEKFMLDGRHTGTGGGNHLVLGGATPADSPFLRRPDLLQSLITYWNNRPSLSYVFSGLFVGPTSQAPRVDEARHESLYELETAFTQLPPREANFPWVIDRALRNLLIDVSGNTHRAEFCIDKLFSPETSTGRLGLVEFRAFEMPPHAQMSLTQQLLVRALVARFSETPYREPLVRWSTSLHDRFLLPHFLAHDLAEIVEELNEVGFGFEHDWFATHFEFRCPKVGSFTQRGIEVELRQAIEPWHVLGEEGAQGGAARYVDSSLERLQVKVSNMTDPRHVLVCNGRRVPLQPTGTPGEFVAGIRFRAWQPPSCLHPTIAAHTPLLIELLDSWNDVSIGGCTWHVAHPGGRNYEDFPVNAYAAETRRHSRFFAFGGRGGKCRIPSREQNADYPCTLDLRRPMELTTLDC